ncbi:hypothetical protein GEMRC1_008945 [Eukaryota sp. GEM-RC1]
MSIVVIGVFLLSCCVLGSDYHWSSNTDGHWCDHTNWEPPTVPSRHSSVVIPPHYTPVTVRIESNTTISSLTISSNITVVFHNNSILTISDSVFVNGGTFALGPSSPLSYTCVESLHWVHGELIFLDLLNFTNLFLYGESKSWPHNSLFIENKFYFNNSLTFSISRLSLSNVSLTCVPGSEFLLDSLFVDESVLEVQGQLNLSSNCSLTSLVPVQSTGTIFIGNDSVMAVHSVLKTSSMIIIFLEGELFLKNGVITFDYYEPYLDPDLFLSYNWIESFNQIDLSGNHEPHSLIIDGPKWKSDSFGGYLDIEPADDLIIPNLPGEFGWRNATISLWIYFEEGEIGFGRSPQSSYSCVFYIRRNAVYWSDGVRFISFPLRQWFHLVITFDQSEARIYVDGDYKDAVTPNTPYTCFIDHPPLFPLSEMYFSHLSDSFFHGRIRAIQIFHKNLTTIEINQLLLDPPVGIWGPGKVSIVDMELMIPPAIFGVKILSLVSSTVYLVHDPPVKLKSIVLNYSYLFYDVTVSDAQLHIQSILLKNTSSIVTDASLVVTNFHWFDGELISPKILALEGLFLYGDSKTWPHNSLVVKNGLYFNNSLTYSISHISLVSITVSCFPGSELVLDSSSLDESLLEVKNQLHLTSNCSLTSLVPVQSTGIIAVSNDSVLTLCKMYSTSSSVLVSPHGELVLKNTSIFFQDFDPYSHPDLFFYCTWVYSMNQDDLSGNHHPNATFIDGPLWKRDEFGGYLEITPGNVLLIPNREEIFSWRSSSLSLWVWFEGGGMGLQMDSHYCRLTIEPHVVVFGRTRAIVRLPLHQWIHVVITTFSRTVRVYVDGILVGSRYRSTSFLCNNPAPFFALSHLHPLTLSQTYFSGRIRAVQIFTRALRLSEIKSLSFDYPGIWGLES